MAASTVKPKPFGMVDGKKVDAYTLTSPTGTAVTVMSYGATVTELRVADRSGVFGDVVLGFDSLAQYQKKSPYFGCIVGRVGNRIASGRFRLDGKEYVLATNKGKNHLHGGTKGYDKRVWASEIVADGVRFTLVDADGSEGYPGTVHAAVVYRLAENTLRIEYEATTNHPTPLNLTNHTYFNLKDAGNTDVLSHVLRAESDFYLPVDETLIPTGEIRPIKNTPIDFTHAKAIGRDLAAMGGNPIGYDHCLVLRGKNGTLALAATVDEPLTGRRMQVWTTQPGVQFYSGNFLDGKLRGKNEATYRQHHGFCLETQHFPDAVNHPEFPSTILRPGEIYRHATEFRFSTTG